MHWYVRCYEDDDTWDACVVWSNSPYAAEKIALNEYPHAQWAEAEMFSTHHHGDQNDYNIYE